MQDLGHYRILQLLWDKCGREISLCAESDLLWHLSLRSCTSFLGITSFSSDGLAT